jgi:hypothetical protein
MLKLLSGAIIRLQYGSSSVVTTFEGKPVTLKTVSTGQRSRCAAIRIFQLPWIGKRRRDKISNKYVKFSAKVAAYASIVRDSTATLVPLTLSNTSSFRFRTPLSFSSHARPGFAYCKLFLFSLTFVGTVG